MQSQRGAHPRARQRDTDFLYTPEIGPQTISDYTLALSIQKKNNQKCVSVSVCVIKTEVNSNIIDECV